MNAAEPILLLRDVHKSFDEAHIIRGVNLSVGVGERHALIGPNGAGKSTLFHLISGHFAPNRGHILFNQKEIQGMTPQRINHLGLARSFQLTNIFPRPQCLRESAAGNDATPWRAIYAVEANLDSGPGSVRRENRTSHGTVASRSTPQHKRRDPSSYSEQRSLEIGMTLASDPKMILLDEPMAGMSQEETDYTKSLILELTRGRTLLIVEHDMQVVFSLSDRVLACLYMAK